MDAGTKKLLGRHEVFSLLFLCSLTVACSPKESGRVNSSNVNGSECASLAKPNSFLIKWKSKVPQEYEKFRLSKTSLTTRFKNVKKEDLETLVLKKHIEDYAVAEHEFVTESVLSNSAPQVSLSDAQPWGVVDSKAQEAWSWGGKQGEGVVVAVIDSGLDVNHPLLSNQVWTNTHEIPGNGIDDDHNGLVDDYTGYDFNGDSPNVTDGGDHGTHVSGIIAGITTNTFSGVAPKAKIMPLKFIDSSGAGSIGDAITAMEYATANGARVINASWGGAQCSDILKDDILTATNAGVIFANAAGNSGKDISKFPEFPAVYQFPGKITVAAHNFGQVLSVFSNYGALVDLSAPGEAILSTVPPKNGQMEGQMATKSGTSMATPFVAGIAALLISNKPAATAAEVVNAINATVTPGKFGVRTGGKLNALDAVKNILSGP